MKYKRTRKSIKIDKQKSFQFDEYVDISNLSKIQKYTAQISLKRVVFLFFIFISFVSIFSIKIFYVSLFKGDNSFTKISNKKFIKNRADIVDRNNVILARNVDSYSVGIRTKFVDDKKIFLLNLKFIFPNLNLDKVSKKIDNSKYFYLKKKISEKEKNELWLLGEKAIIFEKRQIRVYPQKNHFSHVLGQIDYDNNGISGIEKFYDEKLKNKNILDIPLQLSVDSNLQHLIRNELLKAKENFNTIGSAALLMEVDTGKILSLISLPDYDLNHRSSISHKSYTNKITKGVYEMGSVFKVFTIAAAIESQTMEPKTVIKNLDNKIFCAGQSISEHDKLPQNLTVEQILIRSSNIGAVRIAQSLGIEKFKNFLDLFKFFEIIDFELEEVGLPISFRWGKCKLATASFGHGITTTPLQLARAYAILGNGGYEIFPTIINNKNILNANKKRIVSEKTSKSINSMLRKVVDLEEGTANFANIKGYDVAGKTGTAQKSFNGVYTSKKFNTFVSLFPAKQPKHVLLVILDEPKSMPNFIYENNGKLTKGQNRNESGWNSVYVAGKIIEKIGPILATKTLQASKNF